MYSNSRFVVKNKNTVSDDEFSRQGVRQGDGLSPTLFNVFVNDVTEIFDMVNSDPICLESTKVNCLIYADDLLLLSESKMVLTQNGFSWLGPELLVCCLAHRGPTGVFLLLRS